MSRQTSSPRRRRGFSRTWPTRRTINSARTTSWKAALWQALADNGLTLAWVPEEHGGAGASLADGFEVLGVAGPLPRPCRWPKRCWQAGCCRAPGSLRRQGAMTVAPARPGDRITLNADGTLERPRARRSVRPRGAASRGAGARPTASRSRWSRPRRAACRRDATSPASRRRRHVRSRRRRSRSRRAGRLRPDRPDADGLRGARVEIAGALEAILDADACATPRSASPSSGRSPSSRPCSTTSRGSPAKSRPPWRPPARPPTRSRTPTAFDDAIFLEAAAAKIRVAPRPPATAPRSPIRCTARSASPRSTCCTASRCAAGLARRFRQREPLGGRARQHGRGARRRRAVAARRGALTDERRHMTAVSPSTRSACRRNARRCAGRCARSSPRRSPPARSIPHAARPRRRRTTASSPHASAPRAGSA